MRPGRRNRRVDILRDDGTTQDSLGAHVPNWQVAGSRWAGLHPGRGGEKFVQDSERSTQSVVITVPYDELTKTLTPRDRLRYDGDGVTREYDIVSVSDEFTNHRSVQLLCVLRGPEASRT